MNFRISRIPPALTRVKNGTRQIADGGNLWETINLKAFQTIAALFLDENLQTNVNIVVRMTFENTINLLMKKNDAFYLQRYHKIKKYIYNVPEIKRFAFPKQIYFYQKQRDNFVKVLHVCAYLKNSRSSSEIKVKRPCSMI